MLDVVRKTCNAGEKTLFNFKEPCCSYFVKNFTTGPVIVCFDTWDDSQSVMVGAGIAETIVANVDLGRVTIRSKTSTVIVAAEQSGIVEVIRDD